VVGATQSAGSAGPAGPAAAPLPGEPDPRLTPGALNPDVTPATIGRTICVKGWTATVRPPVSYTNRLKVEQIAAYGYADTNPKDYEEDHLVPLEIGGAPRDPANLWPEPRAPATVNGKTVDAAAKDVMENWLHRLVCDGTLALADAQAQMRRGWVHALLGLPLP
jgi:hypothetical protein